MIKFKISVDRKKSARKTSTLAITRADFRLLRELDDSPRGSQCPHLEDHDCENEQLPVDSEHVRDLLLQLDPSMASDGIHPRILKELKEGCGRLSQNLLKKA
ncbi:hypothetical protein WISP_51997 [Willisornis vidua]|uniref:Uncharacterized protein n=1 Tax=Willisornis vidua TaxID=1566151 RepID=A0ABQ9DE32_9PASS|nr:hypothetical protein WISP_51997 [Willisornis vidua]